MTVVVVAVSVIGGYWIGTRVYRAIKACKFWPIPISLAFVALMLYEARINSSTSTFQYIIATVWGAIFVEAYVKWTKRNNKPREG